MNSKRAITSTLVVITLAGAARAVSSLENARRESHAPVSHVEFAELQRTDASLHHQRDELVAQIKQGESQLQTATGLPTADPAAVSQILSAFESQREQVEVDLLGKIARSAEMEKQIKKYQDELDAKQKSDPIAAEMQKVLDPLDQEAARMSANPQTYEPMEIRQSAARAAAQRVVLMERRELFGADRPLLTELRHDQILLAAEIAELRTRMNLMISRSGILRRAADYTRHSDELHRRLKHLNSEIGATEKQIHETSQTTKTSQPAMLQL